MASHWGTTRPDLAKDLAKDLAEDLLDILTVFSARSMAVVARP